MFYAINNQNIRVAADAAKGLPRIPYHCQICGEPVHLRAGTQRIAHYAHVSNKKCDSFAHEMTPWHLGWQAKFPDAEREVVLESDGERHRTDVLHKGVAIEFQHSPISETEFWRRSVFYTNAARHLLWVFDMRQRFAAGIIEEVDCDAMRKKYVWHGHRPTFCGFLPEFYSRITLILQFSGTDNGENVSLCEITHVEGKPLVSQFESSGSRLQELSLREWIDSVLIPKLDLAAMPPLPIVPNIVTHRREKAEMGGEKQASGSESEPESPASGTPPPLEETPIVFPDAEPQNDSKPEEPRHLFPADKCPECGADMVLRLGPRTNNGKFGRNKQEPFWGCKNYAFTNCRGTRTAIPPQCPRCGNTMEARKGRDGKLFWGCPDYPACRGYRPAILMP